MSQPDDFSELKPLRILMRVHAAICFAAAAVLMLQPGLIPGSIGIRLDPSAFFLCYLLGALELAVAWISWFGSRLADRAALVVLVAGFIILHLVTALAESFWLLHHSAPVLVANILLRAVIIFLFFYFGMLRMVRIEK